MSSCWANVHAFVHHVRRNGTCTGGSARSGLSGGASRSPSFFAFCSAQKRVTMSGESDAGTRMANMPSVSVDVGEL